jgi:hypothetical protein
VASRQVIGQMKWIEAMKCLFAENRLVPFLAKTVCEMELFGPDKPDSFALPLSNQELALFLMITPKYLCRVLIKTK